MTTDKLSSDPVLAHFDHIRECITRRWFKERMEGDKIVRWREAGRGHASCLVTPRSTSQHTEDAALIIMEELSRNLGYLRTSSFNDDPKTTKEDIFAFLEECKLIRVAELLEAAVT